MGSWDRIAEERLREAVAAGAFDDLPGAGKPLELEDVSRVPEELRASYLLLKGANVLPEELQLRKEQLTLEDLLAACRDEEEAGGLRARIEALGVKRAILMERRLGRALPREYRARAARRLG